MICYTKNVSALFDNTFNYIPHFCMNTDVLSNDAFTLTDILKQEDIVKFFKVMIKEVDNHENCEHWGMVLREDMPEGCQTIMAI